MRLETVFQCSDGRTEAWERLAMSVLDIECAQPHDDTLQQSRSKNICTPSNTGIRDMSDALPPLQSSFPRQYLKATQAIRMNASLFLRAQLPPTQLHIVTNTIYVPTRTTN